MVQFFCVTWNSGHVLRNTRIETCVDNEVNKVMKSAQMTAPNALLCSTFYVFMTIVYIIR